MTSTYVVTGVLLTPPTKLINNVKKAKIVQIIFKAVLSVLLTDGKQVPVLGCSSVWYSICLACTQFLSTIYLPH